MKMPLELEPLFRTIDARDADGFAGHLSGDAVFVFGNHPPVVGRAAIREAVAGFFTTIAGLRHELVEAWELPGALFCRGRVTYTRPDGSRLCVPFANLLKAGNGGIGEYLIYVDASGLAARR